MKRSIVMLLAALLVMPLAAQEPARAAPSGGMPYRNFNGRAVACQHTVFEYLCTSLLLDGDKES